jgi:16S rRNA (cytosine1402-N4)-methyltransferase
MITAKASRSPRLSHQPVLFQEVLLALAPIANGLYIDGTLGAGGHAAGILELSSPGGLLLGLDMDLVALDLARLNLHDFTSRIEITQSSYTGMVEHAARLGWVGRVNGILLDLGLSSMQLDDPARGFSFRGDAPLDMRFNQHAGSTAAEILNNSDEDELLRIFWEYGEEPHARRLVKSILAHRPVKTTLQLADLCEQSIGRSKSGIHPATRVFQALRIAVNGELENVASVLPQALDLLTPGGRLAIITFHSLEDRIVKHFFQRESKGCICPPSIPVCSCGHKASITIRKPSSITASDEEVNSNPRSRSARLRVAEKLLA